MVRNTYKHPLQVAWASSQWSDQPSLEGAGKMDSPCLTGPWRLCSMASAALCSLEAVPSVVPQPHPHPGTGKGRGLGLYPLMEGISKNLQASPQPPHLVRTQGDASVLGFRSASTSGKQMCFRYFSDTVSLPSPLFSSS